MGGKHRPFHCTPEIPPRVVARSSTEPAARAMDWAVSSEMRLMSSTARLICSLAADCSSEAAAMERT